MGAAPSFDWRATAWVSWLGRQGRLGFRPRLLLLAIWHLGKAEKPVQAHGHPLPSDGDRGTLTAPSDLATNWRAP